MLGDTTGFLAEFWNHGFKSFRMSVADFDFFGEEKVGKLFFHDQGIEPHMVL